MIWVLIAVWFLLNLVLSSFIFHELILTVYSLLTKNKSSKGLDDVDNLYFPKVCIQLPVYNEKYVVENLIDAVIKIKYPNDKLIIQILDDSNDETSDIISQKLESLNRPPIIHHIQRSNREGFKAGALRHGMNLTDAEYFAIFDADFVPDPEFLFKTLSHFSDPSVGVVQTRWSHLNEEFSLLTRAESVMLDAHFGIEQQGRSNAGGFINFNGTAGIWRRTCIEDAGGWEGDTLTEDLDLSFRAQIKNWKIHFLFDFKSPAELPITFGAYKNQQYRWSKGAAECFKKNRKLLWKSNVGLKKKLIGTFHLLNSSVYILILALMLLAPIVELSIRNSNQISLNMMWIANLGLINNFVLLFILLTGKLKCATKKLASFFWFIPSVVMFFLISLAVSPYMTIAVISGYLGRKSEFVRTPKFGINPQLIDQKKYNKKSQAKLIYSIIEFVLMVFGFFWLSIGIWNLDYFKMIYGVLISGAFTIALLSEKN